MRWMSRLSRAHRGSIPQPRSVRMGRTAVRTRQAEAGRCRQRAHQHSVGDCQRTLGASTAVL
eukprot:scaffold62145_cov41-Tisochrysis_lutea.AAC.3